MKGSEGGPWEVMTQLRSLSLFVIILFYFSTAVHTRHRPHQPQAHSHGAGTPRPPQTTLHLGVICK